MAISNYDLSIVPLRHILQNLLGMLSKAEAHVSSEGIDADTLLRSKLAPDMRDFVFQVQVATDVARRGVARLAGTDAPSWPDDEQSFADLRERVSNTLTYFDSFSPEPFADADDRDIALPLRDKIHELSGRDYLQFFILPNVYFHASMVYALLRQNGVALGKRDFLGEFTPTR